MGTLPERESIKVSRYYKKVNVKSVVKSGFADASSKTYGAIIYILTLSNTNETASKLLCSNYRVVPTEVMAILSLELTLCLLF